MVRDDVATKSDTYLNGLKDCSVCVKGKATHLPVHKQRQNPQSETPGEVIHSDVLGPLSPETKYKQKFVVIFVDDCTRYRQTYLMQNKSEVPDMFRRFLVEEVQMHGHTVKRLHSDGALEY